MGAQVEVCTEPERTGRTVHLSAGTYDVNGLRVPAGTSLEGTGAEATILQGTVAGLGTGSFLARVTVTGGTAGGIVVDSGEAPQIRECTIAGNSGTTGGGVYCGNNSSPSFTSCRILENAARAGAGVYCASRSAPTFVNSVISGNVATGGLSAAGGGIFCATNVSLTVLNCTLSANSAEAGGAITLKPRASAVVTNSILWNNQGGSIDPPLTAGMVASHSSIEGDHIWPGEGNTNQDPVFAGNDDFLLQAGSPAIDAGVLEGAPFTDIERRERPCGSGVDMGAYESDCAGPVPEARFIRGDCNADGSTAGVADATTLLSVNFAGAEPPPCLAACDANGDGTTSGVTDAIDLLLFNFSGGPAPPVPFPECGEGALPGDASLGCERPPKACL
jgi:hypothetical protein